MLYDKFHQSLDQIIKSSDPEQRIVWEHVLLLMGENAAIQQFCYIGSIANAPYAGGFVAHEYWFAYLIEWGASGAPSASQPSVRAYDIGNNLVYYAAVPDLEWNATAAQFQFLNSTFGLRNIHFSHFIHVGYTYTRFIGFKIRY